MQRFYRVLPVAALMVLFYAGNALAEGFTFTAPTVDIATLGTMVTGILGALALIWGVRKGIKMINRS